jgi:hypothetical protein
LEAHMGSKIFFLMSATLNPAASGGGARRRTFFYSKNKR